MAEIERGRGLEQRLVNPRVPASRLSGQQDRYKIKLRTVGYRLVYEVRDTELVVVVIAIAKRERNAVYEIAAIEPARPIG
ncbi:MAG: type II toxin-antitoxin system RelE/ParE family toxin [Pseudomonadota bacterium]